MFVFFWNYKARRQQSLLIIANRLLGTFMRQVHIWCQAWKNICEYTFLKIRIGICKHENTYRCKYIFIWINMLYNFYLLYNMIQKRVQKTRSCFSCNVVCCCKASSVSSLSSIKSSPKGTSNEMSSQQFLLQ